MWPFVLSPFFYLGPGRPAPLLDGLLVSFLCPRGGTLATPAQLPQDAPDVARMVPDIEPSPDQPGDPRQGPQFGYISGRTRTCHERLLESGQLFRGQSRQTAGSTGGLQSSFARLLPLSIPSAHTLARNAQLPRNLRLRTLLCEQRGRPQTTFFQTGKIPGHIERLHQAQTLDSVPEKQPAVTLLCESQ